MTDVLRVEGLTRIYPGVTALADVDFAIGHAQVHALLGENGAGKSTFIRLVSGVERPDSGRMTLAGSPYSPASPLAALGAGVSTLYQEQNLLADRSVMHNILVGDEPHRFRLFLDRAAMRVRAREALNAVGADHISVTDTVSGLSVADRQMVDIARALRRDSRLLIMDEPTAALSSREVDALFEVVTDLPRRGVTVLFVSHRMEEIFRISDAVTVLRDGRHVRTSPASSLTPDDLIDAMVGEDTRTELPPRATGQRTEVVLSVERLSGPGFRDVSLRLHRGEILAVAGVTGSGKEHVGLTLFGAVPATGGSIALDGDSVRLTPRAAIRRGIVGVPADRKQDGVIGQLSLRRNLALPSLALLSRAGFVDRRRERALAEKQVGGLAIRARDLDVPVGQLSGGNQQKVSLGKWLSNPPRVMVLMEPTQGIDIKVRYEFYRLVRALADQGTAIVLVSSDVPEVLTLADRIVVLRGGELVGELDRDTATAEALVRLSLGQLSDSISNSALTTLDEVATRTGARRDRC